MSAEEHRGSNDGRFRTFGGSSTQWGGQILPFPGEVFDPPPGSPSLPWPISQQDLTPYYDDVQRILGLNSLPFSEEFLPTIGRTSLPRSRYIEARFAKWTPFKKRNLAHSVGVEALHHSKVTVFTHANVASLDASPTKRDSIRSAQVLNYSGEEFVFEASIFVVCAGTVESSRLLLCSNGIPNAHDQIGRYFFDHVAYHAAFFMPPGRDRAIDLLGPFYIDGTIHSCKLEASPTLRAQEGLLAVMAHVVVIEPEDSGTAAVRNLLRSMQSGRFKEAIAENLLPFLRGIGDVARLIFYSLVKQRRAVSKRAELRLNVDVEQAPISENRIRLSSDKVDALGLPTTVVTWKIGKAEQDTAGRFAHIIRDYLVATGMDPGAWNQSVVDGTPPSMLDTNHPMGGLRMGRDPKLSVVDPNLAVHGLTNLYVASCAVFPSGSSSNPTFNMMALTLRLADHLAVRLAKS